MAARHRRRCRRCLVSTGACGCTPSASCWCWQPVQRVPGHQHRAACRFQSGTLDHCAANSHVQNWAFVGGERTGEQAAVSRCPGQAWYLS